MNLNQKEIKKRIKKRLSMILSLLLIISSVNISSATKTKFADVPDTHWASKVIAKWSGEDYDVLQGDSKGNFNPSKGLTLGEFMTIISKTFGYVQKQETQVTPVWAKESVEKAIAAGIVPKTDKIDANKMITRQEAIKYMGVVFGIQGTKGNTVFIDDQDIDEQYKPYIKVFYDMGYITGDNKDKIKAKFNPKANYTRAEAMQVIDNILSDIIDRYTRDKTYEKNIIIRKAGVNLHNIKVKQNIIIAQGVQDSNISIDKVQIGKSLIIYGGKDITVVSDKMIDNTIINKPYKSVTLRGIFNTITVHDKTTVHIIGKAEKIILLGNAKAKLNLEEVVQTKDDKNQTPSKSTKPITGTPGNGGGAGGGGTTGGEITQGSTGTIPSITVTTKFPTETLSDSAIDIKYIATPSKGASIKEVTYTINDNFTEYLYYASENENERKGTLGQGRVLLQPGQNKIVFTVTDTAGKSGKYIVNQQPTFAEGTYAPDIKADELTPFPDGSGYKFANNRLSLDVKDGTTKEQIEEIARYVNGEVIEHLFTSGMVTIKVPKNSLEGLRSICSDIKKRYPNIIEYADIERFGNIGFDSISDNQESNVKASSPTKDPWWFPDKVNEKYMNWAIKRVKVPEAWKEYKENLKHNVRVGIIDSRIYNNHPDLKIPNSNISNGNHKIDSHGTRVMGIIAAVWNNEIGLSGITDFDRENYYAYSLPINGNIDISTISILRGLEWNVIRGVKVINVSVGNNSIEGEAPTDSRYSVRMKKFLSKGYDYIVVQSAGNTKIDANLNGIFANVQDPELIKNIITVGGSNELNQVLDSSNHGSRVDVVAPGDNIYSTSLGKNIDNTEVYYDYEHGTSFSAPFVTGVAALVWSEMPSFSGKKVKEIIVNSARKSGDEIEDKRMVQDPLKYQTKFYKQINADAAVQMAVGNEQVPSYTKGRLVGLVVNAKDEKKIKKDKPVSDAVIKLYKKTENQDIKKGMEVKSVKTDVDGYYRIDDIIPGEYRFTVEAPGYVTEIVNVNIEPWITTNIHKLKFITKSDKKGKSTGKVTNATTGLPVSDSITLEFRRGIDPDLTESAEVIQSENGRYSIELPAGNYTVTAKADGYITSTRYVVSYGDDITSEDQDIVISPKMIQGESSLRAVLTWGETPRDLDSHLIGPKPDDRKFHLCFYRKKTYYKNEIYNTLDVDDTYYYGPETVTINKLVDGTYDYYVRDYTNRDVTSSPQLSVSEAMVQVYDNNGMLKTFKVPLDQKGTVWHVFKLIVKDNRHTVIPVGRIGDFDLYQYDTNEDYPGEVPTEPIPDSPNPTDPISPDPSDPIPTDPIPEPPTDPIPEPPPNSIDSNESNQESNENSPNSAINEEEKETKVQSRKQSDIDSNNSDLKVKKDDSDKQGINQSTTNN